MNGNTFKSLARRETSADCAALKVHNETAHAGRIGRMRVTGVKNEADAQVLAALMQKTIPWATVVQRDRGYTYPEWEVIGHWNA